MPDESRFFADATSARTHLDLTLKAPYGVSINGPNADEQNQAFKELYDNVVLQVKEAASVMGVSSAVAKMLLERCKWQSVHLYSLFFENGGSVNALNQQLGCPILKWDAVSTEEMTCTLCFENVESLCGAECGHKFCPSCWLSYVRWNMKNTSNMCTIFCPAYGCNMPVDDSVYMKFLTPVVAFDHTVWVARRYVDSCAAYGWCRCERHLQRSIFKQHPLRCRCGRLRCAKCSEEWHDPIDCSTMKTWEAILSTHMDSFNWLRQHCKLCPNCGRPVQKMGGCNQVRCICNQLFCWNCLEQMDTIDAVHAYTCVNLPRRTTGNVRGVYFRCYENFQKTFQLNHRLITKVEVKLRRVLNTLQMDSDFLFQEQSLVDQVIQLFMQAALFAQYTCIFADSVKDGGNGEQRVQVFLMHVDQLRRALDDAMEKLEPNMDKYTWSTWWNIFSNSYATMKIRYESARSYWLCGIETGDWNVTENFRLD